MVSATKTMFSLNRVSSIILLLSFVAAIQAEFQLKAAPVISKKQTNLIIKSTEVTKFGKKLYNYVCTVGQNKTALVGCFVKSSNDWPVEQNLELTASCDKSPEAQSIQYFEASFAVATQNVACSISSGSIGSTYVELKFLFQQHMKMSSAKHLTNCLLFVYLSCLQAFTVVPSSNPMIPIAEPTYKHLKVTPYNYAEEPVLKELNTIEKTESGDTLYKYVCTVGLTKTDAVGCAGSNSSSWSNKQNMELTVGCEKSDDGRLINYVEVEFFVSSQNVACSVSAGSIGTSHIEVKVTAFGTLTLESSSAFYIY
ncbi:uncharacterized protein [Musca autumnalis]|uniref:uncharacterized protein n=1 Tax=Musca autumnalis TaxID=221902 RepID=UPI003CEA70EF